jgi:hypothetical protein
MVTVAVALPPELDAVTVYSAAVVRMVGIPPITPVVALRLSPAGRAGLTRYDVTVPPLFVGPFGVIRDRTA